MELAIKLFLTHTHREREREREGDREREREIERERERERERTSGILRQLDLSYNTINPFYNILSCFGVDHIFVSSHAFKTCLHMSMGEQKKH